MRPIILYDSTFFFAACCTTISTKNRLLYEHSTSLSNFNNTLGYILYCIIALSWPCSAFVFYVLLDNVFISLLMCICCIMIKGCLLTYDMLIYSGSKGYLHGTSLIPFSRLLCNILVILQASDPPRTTHHLVTLVRCGHSARGNWLPSPLRRVHPIFRICLCSGVKAFLFFSFSFTVAYC